MNKLAIILAVSIVGSGAWMTQHWIMFSICTFILGFMASEAFCDIKHGRLDPE